ncbi:hypothetical protein OG349_30720 [Streptomyces sp. NBC_01317]|uniref:hypothetical protein n=1 Tax=Streptomyces sp. NBC_01317 TaxID=2903822 RepID=UPI002E149733|nr:hypothetical protein OG349_30720 [Streptomyces sp. NBC_01317]
MWPGQQPPGGEQNPQDQNPNPYQQPGYQQPGYAQPNPYQQPGYPQQPGYQQQPGYPAAPNPYQQPTVPQYAVPGPPGPGGPGPSGGGRKTTVVAIVAALAVVVAAGVTGFLVLGGSDDSAKDTKGDDQKPSVSAKPSTSSPAANPRDGAAAAKPQITGWKVVSNPKYGTLFDVPADWEVEKPTVATFFEDEKKGDGSPIFSFSAPAFYKSKWCSQDADRNGETEDSSLVGTGTKGARGAKDTPSSAEIQASNLVWAAYAQKEPEAKLKTILKTSKGAPFTTTSGLEGSYSISTTTGVTKKTKCETDGKAIAFSFVNTQGEYATWVAFAAKGVTDEVPDETLKKIMGTVRLAGAS